MAVGGHVRQRCFGWSPQCKRPNRFLVSRPQTHVSVKLLDVGSPGARITASSYFGGGGDDPTRTFTGTGDATGSIRTLSIDSTGLPAGITWIEIRGYGDPYVIDDIYLEFDPLVVPEPGTSVMVSVSALLAFAVRRIVAARARGGR
jgi:hypothetical protein